MTDIPEDIKKAAEAAFYEAWDHGHDEAIARAILAERERCAQIADQQVFDDHALAQATEFGRGCHETATRIAAAIRSPERVGE